MGLNRKTIRGFKQGACVLSALASVQSKEWTVKSRSRETRSETVQGQVREDDGGEYREKGWLRSLMGGQGEKGNLVLGR